MLKGYKAIIQELSGTALNFPAGELQKLITKTDEELTEEESTEIANKLKEHYRNIVTQINVSANKKLDDQFKAGQRKKAEEFEAFLKERFAVDSDKSGTELIDEIAETVSKKSAKKTGNELTDDDVKKHAAYLKMENEFKAQLKKAKEDSEKAITDLKAGYEQKEVFSELSKEALSKFREMNPVLSEDPKKAAAQESLVVEKLEKYDWQKVDGKYVPFYKDGDKKGKKVENEFGVTPEFDAVLKETVTPLFDFKVADDRKSPNGGGGTGADDKDKNKVTTYKGALPKTEEEYQKMQSDTNIPLKDRMAINDYWSTKASA